MNNQTDKMIPFTSQTLSLFILELARGQVDIVATVAEKEAVDGYNGKLSCLPRLFYPLSTDCPSCQRRDFHLPEEPRVTAI